MAEKYYEAIDKVHADPSWGTGPKVGERLRAEKIAAIRRLK